VYSVCSVLSVCLRVCLSVLWATLPEINVHSFISCLFAFAIEYLGNLLRHRLGSKVVCVTARSAILAAAWLLVFFHSASMHFLFCSCLLDVIRNTGRFDIGSMLCVDACPARLKLSGALQMLSGSGYGTVPGTAIKQCVTDV